MKLEKKIRLWMVGSVGIDDVQTRSVAKKNLMGGSLPFSTVAASFFTRPGGVGVVGSDFPTAFQKRWERFGIDLAGVQKRLGKTFRWSCVYDEDMIERTTLKTELGVFADFSPELPDAYKKVPFIMLGNIHPDLQQHLLEQAVRPRFVALDTMNLWIETSKKILKKVISQVDLLTLNDGEARLLAGKWNLRECADELLKTGIKYLIIKKGEHGSILFSKKDVFIVPAYPVRKVVDPTGAGDAYAGAFMGYLAREGKVSNRSLREALIQASAVASFCVEGFSLSRFEKLTPEEIDQRVKELKRMM